MVQIKVIFDSPTKTYSPGDTVRVQVIITTSKGFKTRCMSVRFRGACETRWSVHASYYHSEQWNPCIGEEDYFKHYIDVLGERDGQEIDVPAGEHIYHVEYRLPSACLPSSFEHEYGFIRYTVKVTIEKAWAISENLTEIFRVNSPLDLSLFPNIDEPIKQETTDALGCLCCESGPISFVLNLPKTTFIQTDPIPVILEVENLSNRDLLEIKAQIVEKITLEVREPYKDTKEKEVKIAEVKFEGGLEKLQRKIFKGEILIPSDYDVVNTQNCTFIECQYVIIGKVAGLEVGVNIILSSAPFKEIVERENDEFSTSSKELIPSQFDKCLVKEQNTIKMEKF